MKAIFRESTYGDTIIIKEKDDIDYIDISAGDKIKVTGTKYNNTAFLVCNIKRIDDYYEIVVNPFDALVSEKAESAQIIKE